MPGKAFNADFGGGHFGGRVSRGYLQVIVGDHATYEDGDILSAINWRRVRHTFAEGICFQRGGGSSGRMLARLNGHGYMPMDDVLTDWYEASHQYKLERLSATTQLKTRLSDSATVEITDGVEYTDLTGKPATSHVGLWWQRRIATWTKDTAQGRPLFSDDGDVNTLVCYLGRSNHDHANLDTIWTAIETKTAHTEDGTCTHAPFSNYRKRLVISVDDFDNETAGELTSSLVDETDPENPITIKKRKNFAEWRDLRDVNEGTVLNKQSVVRIDNIRKHVRSQILQAKSLP